MELDPNTLDELIKKLDLKEAKDLFGSDGVVPAITKRLMERMLQAELDDHLGYEKGERGAGRRENHRNGSTSKRVKTDSGEVDLAVPRDRDGTFEPQVVKKRQTRIEGFDDKVISLYARGLSTRQIQGHLKEIYGTEVSPDLISRVTAAVMDDVREWRSRPLAPVWPIVYLDALVIRVREGGMVRRKSAYLAIGVGLDGHKQVLGLWLEETEGAKFWLKVINESSRTAASRTFSSPASMASKDFLKPSRRCSPRPPCRPASFT